MRKLIALFLIGVALAAATARPAYADSIVLDPANPLANFTMETAKVINDASITPGTPLLVNDPTADDLITLYAAAPFAAPGLSFDLIVNFRVQPGETLQGIDSGVRFAINDGSKAAYFNAIINQSGVKGIAIASATDFGADASYLASSFVAVDWTNPGTADGRVTLQLRRTAEWAGIVAVNGVAPSTPVQLLIASLPGPLRPRLGPTIEFGVSNLEAIATLELAEFRAFTVPEPSTLLLLGSGLAGLAVFRKRFKG